ncbi:uncharacterized protein KZ484_009208 [Pholidichthys leucotaenia]
MSAGEDLRSLLNQRLSVVVDEIVELFNRTVADYQTNVRLSLEETEQRDRASVLSVAHSDTPADSQVLVRVKEEPEASPNKQKWNLSSSDWRADALHIKEEPVEVWIGHEERQHHESPASSQSSLPLKSESPKLPYIIDVFQGDAEPLGAPEVPCEQEGKSPVVKQEPEPHHPEEQRPRKRKRQVAVKKMVSLSLKPTHVKCEKEEVQPLQPDKPETKEKAESSAARPAPQQKKTDDIVSEPAPQPVHDKTPNSSATEDSEDDVMIPAKRQTYKQISAPHPNEMPNKADVTSKPSGMIDLRSEEKTSDSSDSEHENRDAFQILRKAFEDIKAKPADTTFRCVQCGKCFLLKAKLDKHMRSHSSDGQLDSSGSRTDKDGAPAKKMERKQDKCFPCSRCGKRFKQKTLLVLHMRMHDEKADS